MSAAWLDEAVVALILLAATAYLARKAMRRVSTAFGRGAAGTNSCGTDCGCGVDAGARSDP